jgi:hypothetical protein
MTVAELICFLQTQPQDALVAYCRYSEQCLMEPREIMPYKACPPRPDGWVQDERPDMPTQTYVLFPGN